MVKLCKLIAFLLLIILLTACGINEKNLTTLEENLNKDEKLGEYFTQLFIHEDSQEETTKYKEYKLHNYTVSANGNQRFFSLSDEGKLKIVEEIAEVVKKQYNFNFIDCGEKHFCNITRIYAFSGDDEGKSDAYMIDFSKEKNKGDYNMEVSYYDENDKFQTRTVSKSRSISAGSSTSSNISTLTLEETSCSLERNYMYAKGYVKNNSNQHYSFIQIRADFIDSSGNVLDTNFTYAVGGEGLASGSRKSYEIMAPINDSVTQCYYKIVDYK